jgi:hypothetical protein
MEENQAPHARIELNSPTTQSYKTRLSRRSIQSKLDLRSLGGET